eukprot:TRINITY_DN7389_c0_g1_i1.p1 TRINITY_DN7389_c0_g1~~TRINITY_DN7389_c0_g1_i1.p1  ORF type:complete len:249 (-),score=57.20 TRINITY_DN7389_c0_g1_i1:70-816(-)
MEFCPTTLQIMERPGSLVRRISLAMEICRGLSFLHRMGIVHGDLKPANVLISEHEVAKLSEFGLSFSAFSSVSRVGGTTRFSPPEFCLSKRERSRFDPRLADIFALGGVLVFLFSGKLPWNDEDETYITRGMTRCILEKKDFLPTDELDLIRNELKDTCAENVCSIIAKCFSANPDSRGSSRKILSEFESMLDLASRKGHFAANVLKQQEQQKGAESEVIEQVVEQMGQRVVSLGGLLVELALQDADG